MKNHKLLILILLFCMTGCSALSRATPQPLPTIELGQGNPPSQSSTQVVSGGVTASGVIAPAQRAKLAFGLGGKIETLDVSVGDRVEAGQVLARLEGQENLEASVSTAEFELLQAQQSLEDLTNQVETNRVQAMQDIVKYERAVRDAQYALYNFTVPSNQANFDAVEALNKMQVNLDKARAAFEPYRFEPSEDKTRKDRKEALDAAQADYNAAVRRLQLEYDLEAAQVYLDKALHEYDILKSGPDPDKVRLAEARQTNAQNQLVAAQAALKRLTLTASFAGTVSRLDLNIGEWVIAGQPILELADLDNLHVETTDLSERDVPQVQVGQPVEVIVKALGLNVSGHVSKISPLAATLGGDVVYKITVELDAIPPGLREGMSVDVQFIPVP